MMKSEWNGVEIENKDRVHIRYVNQREMSQHRQQHENFNRFSDVLSLIVIERKSVCDEK